MARLRCLYGCEGLSKLIQPIPTRAIQARGAEASKQTGGRRDEQATVQDHHQALLLESKEEDEYPTFQTTIQDLQSIWMAPGQMEEISIKTTLFQPP